MDIKGFIENSLIEWEGKISSIIFLPGCNMRCRYCHAGHLVVNPEAAESIAREQVMDYLRRHTDWIDGVVITGGEPTLHGQALLELIEEIRAIPLMVMIETNGSRPEWLGRLIREGLLDAVAMDVKAPLTPRDYRRVTRADIDVDDVRASVRMVLESGLEHEFRMTIAPGIIGREELPRMGAEVQGACRIALQNFRPELCLDEELRSVHPYSPEEMDAFKELMEPFAELVLLRGREYGLTAGVAAL